MTQTSAELHSDFLYSYLLCISQAKNGIQDVPNAAYELVKSYTAGYIHLHEMWKTWHFQVSWLAQHQCFSCGWQETKTQDENEINFSSSSINTGVYSTDSGSFNPSDCSSGLPGVNVQLNNTNEKPCVIQFNLNHITLIKILESYALWWSGYPKH